MKRWVSILVMSLLPVADMSATECVVTSQREAFARASVVFRGTVTEILALDERATRLALPGENPKDNPVLVKFSVDRAWKGTVTLDMAVFLLAAPKSGGGYRFVRQRPYVVYALSELRSKELDELNQGQQVYSTGFMCPLRIREDIASESRKLGRAHAPEKGEQPAASH